MLTSCRWEKLNLVRVCINLQTYGFMGAFVLLYVANEIQHIFDRLVLTNFQVYTKPKGRLPDYTSPVVLRSTKCTVEDFVSSNP
jgi:hypothetical protein